ncbi:MAG: hypothetical protein AB7F32_08030 [Victivallaceae bacterium]
MKKFSKALAGLLCGPKWMLGRGLVTLAAAGVIYFYPDRARQIFAGLIWAIPAAAILWATIFAGKTKSPLAVWFAAAIPAAAAMIFLAFAKINVVGVWGIGLWALLAAISLGWAGLGRNANWQTRLAALAGAVLAGMAAFLFVRRANPDFMASSALFALFFAALGVLLLAAIPVNANRK